MNVFTTSDIHFLHKSILKYCPVSRPYGNIDEMDEAIVHNWNKTISPDDLTYILGDITFGSVNKTIDLLHRLNGKKILIEGNHDHDALEKHAFRECFESIHKYLEIKHHGELICMFHYPIKFWNKRHYGSLHLHGHLHSNPSGIDGRIMDVGMDTNWCHPYLLNDIVDKLTKIPLPGVNHHDA